MAAKAKDQTATRPDSGPGTGAGAVKDDGKVTRPNETPEQQASNMGGPTDEDGDKGNASQADAIQQDPGRNGPHLDHHHDQPRADADVDVDVAPTDHRTEAERELNLPNGARPEDIEAAKRQKAMEEQQQ